ncbi:hypothetical protein U1Q18_025182, partial [Sarracenia purpurea var. burkii]
RTNEDVVSIHALTKIDDVRTPFEPMDMFDLGMEYSNDGDIDGGDNESGEKGGDNESGEGINAEEKIMNKIKSSIMRRQYH